MKLGKLGAWSLLHGKTAAETAAFAQRVEKWGYGALWIWEGLGRDAIASAAWLLANTKILNIGTGFATIYARDATGAKHSQYTLAEQSGGRFLLGLSPSHKSAAEGRGLKYGPPAPTMKAYLEAMAKAGYNAPAPAEKPKTVVAALEPGVLALAAGPLADGAHSYSATPEQTAAMRKVLGPEKLLCPEQAVLLESDPSQARAIGRAFLTPYLDLPAYREGYLHAGFTETDLDGGGSDKLIDAVIAWGDETKIRKRIQEHWDAGADHVCLQSLPREGLELTAHDEKVFELLAPG